MAVLNLVVGMLLQPFVIHFFSFSKKFSGILQPVAFKCNRRKMSLGVRSEERKCRKMFEVGTNLICKYLRIPKPKSLEIIITGQLYEITSSVIFF